jgi:hypothetical protein
MSAPSNDPLGQAAYANAPAIYWSRDPNEDPQPTYPFFHISVIVRKAFVWNPNFFVRFRYLVEAPSLADAFQSAETVAPPEAEDHFAEEEAARMSFLYPNANQA